MKSVLLVFFLLSFLYISSAQAGPGDGMLVYSNDENTPRYRVYDEGTDLFESQNAAGTSLSAEPPYAIVRACPVRDEYIAGFVDNNKRLYVRVWDGSSWDETFGYVTVGGKNKGNQFDIAYENSGDAIVVYSTDTNGRMQYRVWDGTSWSSAQNLDSAYITGEKINWIKMASHPTTDEIALVFSDDDSRLSAFIWDGSLWGNEPSSGLSNNCEVEDGSYEAFDLAYESSSGDLLVVWGDKSGNDGTNGVRYATYESGSWTAVNQTPSGFSDDATNVDLSADPLTDQVS
jgi:hypothetical protein